MRIAVDCRSLNTAFVRGMGRYLFGMLGAVDSLAEIQWEVYGDRPEFPMALPKLRSVNQSVFETKGWRFHAWEQWSLPRKARACRADVLFCPGTTLPWLQPLPTVVTLHDMVPWNSDECAGERSFYWRRLQPAALRKAAAIVTVSESSRRDILATWPAFDSKVHVIPHGISEEWRDVPPEGLPSELMHLGVDMPYLLYVGGDIPRKRLDWALRVFAAAELPNCKLVICGATEGMKAKIAQAIPSSVVDRVVLLPFVAEDQLPRLMRQAMGVLYPTTYEGFGFPAVESQAVGTPILFSAVGSLVELVGPGAMVLPLNDFDAWVAACRTVYEQRSVEMSPNEPARAWAKKFTWQESARRHLELWRTVA